MSKLFNLNVFDFVKGAIVAVFVAILTYIQQSLTDGGLISTKIILTTSITSLLGYILKQLMTDSNGSILSMIGGRKKRKKRPTSINNGVFEFTETLFTMDSFVTYTSDLISIPEVVTIRSVYDSVDGQTVIFNEPIQYTAFESILFEIEVN